MAALTLLQSKKRTSVACAIGSSVYHVLSCYFFFPKPEFLSKAFQRHQEHDLKHPGLMDLIITKQNKRNYLPSYT
jgi:hypothetical protein